MDVLFTLSFSYNVRGGRLELPKPHYIRDFSPTSSEYRSGYHTSILYRELCYMDLTISHAK